MKKAVRLSVGDFGGHMASARNIIVRDGAEFPSTFTINQPGTLDGVAFCVCTSGSATVKINSRIYHIASNSLITILPNHIVEPIERSDDLRLKMVILSLDLISAMQLQAEAIRAAGGKPCIEVTDGQKELLCKMHELISKLNVQPDYPQRQPVLQSMLCTFVLQIEALYSNTKPTGMTSASKRGEELTEQFLKLLVLNFNRQHSPSFYADKLFVTTKHLSQTVKEITGESVFEWINKIIVLAAKNMLSTTSMSVLQISEELCFPNPSFFGRYFKKHAGMTPLEYRKSI